MGSMKWQHDVSEISFWQQNSVDDNFVSCNSKQEEIIHSCDEKYISIKSITAHIYVETHTHTVISHWAMAIVWNIVKSTHMMKSRNNVPENDMTMRKTLTSTSKSIMSTQNGSKSQQNGRMCVAFTMSLLDKVTQN